MSDPGNKESGGLIARMPIKACTFHGWIVGWAVMTFGSALTLSMLDRNSTGFAETAYDAFQVADLVPPIGKLSLGLTFAALLLLARHSNYLRIGASIAGAIAFAIALILPTSYYPEESKAGLLWLTHPACGAIGGLVAALVISRCDLRGKSASANGQTP